MSKNHHELFCALEAIRLQRATCDNTLQRLLVENGWVNTIIDRFSFWQKLWPGTDTKVMIADEMNALQLELYWLGNRINDYCCCQTPGEGMECRCAVYKTGRANPPCSCHCHWKIVNK